MSDRLAAFRPQTARELLALLRAQRGQPRGGVRVQSETLPIAVGNFICQANAEIPPLAGNTPGSGMATLWAWSEEEPEEDDVLEALEEEVRVYNLSSAAIAAGKFLVGIKVGNRRVIIFEACGDDEE